MSECTTRDILEALDYDELNALRRRSSWCGADWKNGRDELLKSMNISATGAINHGDLTPTQLVEDINNLVVKQGSKKIETQIQSILRETPITKVAGWKSETEAIACAHLTGVLQGQLGSRFDIIQEKTFDNKFIDIYLKDNTAEKEFFVEAKVNKRFTPKTLMAQINDYKKLLDNGCRTYVVFIVFGNEYYELKGESHQNQIYNYLGESKASSLEEMDDVEVVLNLNPPQ